MNVKDDLQQRWWNLEAKLVDRFGKKPDMEAILFLIGIQEFGEIREKYTKEQKQDLMHVAVCSLLSPSGYYELENVDAEGWPPELPANIRTGSGQMTHQWHVFRAGLDPIVGREQAGERPV